jgi:AraC-like DNA-binding protein
MCGDSHPLRTPLDTPATVATIALELGHDSAAGFARAFR